MVKTVAKTIIYLPLEIKRHSQFKGQSVRLLLDASFESILMFDYFSLSGAKISAYCFDVQGVEKWQDVFAKKSLPIEIIRNPLQTHDLDLNGVWVAPAKLTISKNGMEYEFGSSAQLEGVKKFQLSTAIESLLLDELLETRLFKAKKIILNERHLRSLGLAQTQVYFRSAVYLSPGRRNFLKTTAKTAAYLLTLGLLSKSITGANLIDQSYAKDTKPGDPQPCYHPVTGNPIKC